MVVTRSSARSHDAPKGPIKALATARERVDSSWRVDARATRQTRSDAAAGEATPESPSLVKDTPPRRYLQKKVYATSIATHQVGDSDNDEEAEDGDEPQDNGESDAADDQEEVGSGLVQIPEVEHSESRPFRVADASLNPDVLIRLRGNLYKAAQDLYNHLRSTSRDGTWEFLLDCFRNIFDQWKAHYTTHKTPFIDCELISDALSQQSQPDASAVSHVVSAANLVTLMDSIHRVGDQVEDSLDLFRKIDEDFPGSIMAPESARTEAFAKYDTFGRALDTRISLWILEAVNSGAFTKEAAKDIGSALLFSTSPEGEFYPKKIDWEEFDDHENEGAEKSEMREQIFRVFEDVCATITDEKVDLQAILGRYPIDQYLEKLSSWAQNLFAEVVDTIEKQSARPATNPAALKTPGNAGRQKSGQSLHKGKSSVQFLASAKKRRHAPAAEADTSSRKSPRRERSSETYHTPAEDSGESEEEDGDRGSEGSARPETADGDVYEFRGDSREEDRPRQRAPRSPVSPLHKKPKTRIPYARRAQAPESTSADNAPLAPGEEGMPPASTATTRQPQRRAFWEKEDERTLRELVAVHGSFWVHMEKKARREELFLVPRTQQQIRDKARNMKVDYLKDDKLLPSGFDHVLLGKKEEARLIGLGKNPERKEADVQDGRPVNTEWAGEEE